MDSFNIENQRFNSLQMTRGKPFFCLWYTSPPAGQAAELLKEIFIFF